MIGIGVIFNIGHRLNFDQSSFIGLSVNLEKNGSSARLVVEAANDIFGPQPYLALKTKSGEYLWQNFDFDASNKWSYAFDMDNILIEQIAEIGVASNTITGLTEVVNLVPETLEQKTNVLNNG